MGAVVAATPLAGGGTVAIKFMLPRLTDEERFVARFLREARATFRLTSAHVPRVFEVGALESGAPYIVMEYLDGTDLRSLVKDRGPVGAREAADYVAQSCSALAEAHALGIVHRDLKPANLLLAKRPGAPPIIKVLDFGVAKVASAIAGDRMEMTNTDTVLGSRLYMSPEQMRNPRDVDGRADVWALGVCLYYLVTGTTPFAAETTEEVILKVLLHPPFPLRERAPGVPAEYEEIVYRCLEKAPQMRYASVTELAQALAPVVRGEATRRVTLPPGDAETLLETTPVRVLTPSEGPWLRTNQVRLARRLPWSAIMAASGLVVGAGVTFAIVGLHGAAVAETREAAAATRVEAIEPEAAAATRVEAIQPEPHTAAAAQAEATAAAPLASAAPASPPVSPPASRAASPPTPTVAPATPPPSGKPAATARPASAPGKSTPAPEKPTKPAAPDSPW